MRKYTERRVYNSTDREMLKMVLPNRPGSQRGPLLRAFRPWSGMAFRGPEIG
jgi:hypothetical protein